MKTPKVQLQLVLHNVDQLNGVWFYNVRHEGRNVANCVIRDLATRLPRACELSGGHLVFDKSTKPVAKAFSPIYVASTRELGKRDRSSLWLHEEELIYSCNPEEKKEKKPAKTLPRPGDYIRILSGSFYDAKSPNKKYVVTDATYDNGISFATRDFAWVDFEECEYAGKAPDKVFLNAVNEHEEDNE